MKATSRASELKRIASKQGWYDGNRGASPRVLTRMIARGQQAVAVPCAQNLQRAYWNGFEKGRCARAGSKNPFLEEVSDMRVKKKHHVSEKFTKEMAWNLMQDAKVIHQRLQGISPSLTVATVEKILDAARVIESEALEILAEISRQ